MNKNIKLIYPKATRIFNKENLLTKRWNMIIATTYYVRINGKKYLLNDLINHRRETLNELRSSASRSKASDKACVVKTLNNLEAKLPTPQVLKDCRHLKVLNELRSSASKTLNHYSNPNIITEKANLSKIVKENEYLSSIHPKTYILKVNKTSEKEIDDFIKSFGEKNMLIVKPAGLYGGQGIQIFNNLDDVYDYVSKDKESSYIMQQYITNPLLLDKKKFDIRVHVLLDKDYNIYINKYAVMRKTKSDYNNNFTGDWEIDKFIHITNYSVQKDAIGNKEEILGISQMLELFSDKELTSQVVKIVKTLLLQVKGRLKPWTFSDSTSKINCYEMLGFDILLDENYKAWLLEVNLNPIFSWNSPAVDAYMELTISDMFKIILLSDKVKYSRNKSSWKKI
jgi:hypothetical protein